MVIHIKSLLPLYVRFSAIQPLEYRPADMGVTCSVYSLFSSVPLYVRLFAIQPLQYRPADIGVTCLVHALAGLIGHHHCSDVPEYNSSHGLGYCFRQARLNCPLHVYYRGIIHGFCSLLTARIAKLRYINIGTSH